MTRPLNFTVKEILPALLDRSKTQTIRKAWNDKSTCFWCDKKFENLSAHCKNNHEELSARSYDYEKAATYQVGDKLKVYWNQRSKDKMFCKFCGNGERQISCKEIRGKSKDAFFNKLLGEVEITGVFKIEMLRERSEDSTSGFINHLSYDLMNIHLPFPASETLAKRDGFKSSKEMFEIIDKMYDLASPKTFWVYRWVWK